MVTEPVRAEALRLAGSGELPAYVYDLEALRGHAARVRAATAGTAELYYAVKANPAAEILRALDPYVDGFEVASGGELAHVREVVPGRPVAFSGPGKTDEELAVALTPPVHRLHVESPRELARLIARGAPVDVLLRANPDLPGEDTRQAAASPFGMDPDGLAACLPLLADAPHIRVRGLHAHLTWARHDAPAMAALARRVTDWALPWLREHLPGLDDPELDLGGGMGVDYGAPDRVFDWPAYAAALPATEARLRVEPGRSLTAYHGWYVTDVLDVKRNHGRDYAVLRGGTHHLRTPVARGHDQPFVVVPRAGGGGPALTGPATLVGQLCTPRDVLARDVPVTELRPGDLVVFELAGAYAWNLSHHDFLMHPRPRFRYLD